MINRDLYKGYFTQDDILKWQCPTCNSGSLKAIKEKFLQEHNSETAINYHEDWFEVPEMITYTFTALLSCTNPNCKEIVSCSGTGHVEQEQYTYDDFKYVEYFKPFFFYPALNIFQIPKKTPDNVTTSIKSSFSLLFTNKSASANQIRIALEDLLTHLKVNRTYINSHRKRKSYTLHARIELLPAKYSHIKELCLAIKWLGNSGSHSDEELSFDNIFDGYDMLSFVLNELYDSQEKHAKKLAKIINLKKGV